MKKKAILFAASVAIWLVTLGGCIFGGGGRETTSEHIFVEPGAKARVATDTKIPITTTDEKGGQHFEKKNIGGMYVIPESVLKKLSDFWEQGHRVTP